MWNLFIDYYTHTGLHVTTSIPFFSHDECLAWSTLIQNILIPNDVTNFISSCEFHD